MALEREQAEILFEQTLAASRRWRDTPHLGVDTVERRTRFAERETRRALTLRPAAEHMPVVGQERVIGVANFRDFPPDQAAKQAGLPVARVVLLPEPGLDPLGFGTGFLVAPGILITNNHVLPNEALARRCGAQFAYERTHGGVRRGEIFELDSDQFFHTNAELDFTLVAVKPLGTAGQSLSSYGLARLIAATGKIVIGQPVNIIQHPAGEPKQYVTEDNQLVAVPDQYLHYHADTRPGSSGSPAFNTQWEVVALHHSAIGPMRDGHIITKTGQIFTRGMADDEVAWIANEGVRASVIVEAVREAARQSPGQAPFFEQILRETGDPLEASATTALLPQLGGNMNVTFTGPVTIYVGGTAAPAIDATKTVPAAPAAEGVSIDPNYAQRGGYQRNFLTLAVNLPVLTPAHQANASQELTYHHFSIVMNKARRLAFYTAVNIDGRAAKRPSRSGDAWFFDPRLDRKFQIGEFLYASNPLDRGHLVRRLDPAWGSTSMAKKANDDTFHFTNCSPQHANLNQKIWNDLEDYLLDHADQENLRLTVFTGPVFEANDPIYRGVALPRRFWKVAVMKAQDGKPLAAGFMQSQATMIRDLREADFLAAETRTDQVRIVDLQTLLGMNFGLPLEADPLEADDARESLEGMSIRPLETLESIKLR